MKNTLFTIFKHKTDADGNIINATVFFNEIDGTFIDGYKIEDGKFTKRLVPKKSVQKAGFFLFLFQATELEEAFWCAQFAGGGLLGEVVIRANPKPTNSWHYDIGLNVTNPFNYEAYINNATNTGSSGGSNYLSSGQVTSATAAILMVAPIRPGINGKCTSGYVKNEETNECDPISNNEDDQIINELTGKEKCAYEKLKELNLFKTTIKKFDNNDNYHLILKSWTVDACNSPNDDGCTDASDLKNGNITIYIQNSNEGTLDVATTILHEGLHAEMYKYVDEHKKGLDPNQRENLLHYYFEYKVDNNGNRYSTSDAQHQHMADVWITPIARALRQLDKYQFPLNDYLSLAWDGLRNYGIKSANGIEGYWKDGKWTTLDKDKSYEGKSKILKNTKFNRNCK